MSAPTPAMIAAGAEALRDVAYGCEDASEVRVRAREIAEAVWKAMSAAAEAEVPA